MLNMLCCVGQVAEGKFHLVLVCFAAGRIHPTAAGKPSTCSNVDGHFPNLLGLAWLGPLGKKVGCSQKYLKKKKRGGSPPKLFLYFLLQGGTGHIAKKST